MFKLQMSMLQIIRSLYLFINGLKTYMFLIAECLPDGTVQVTNPNVGVYSHVFAVQDEGVSAAVKCTVSSSGAQSNITGCSQVSLL